MQRNAMLEVRSYKREDGEANLHDRRTGILPVISKSRLIRRKETAETAVLLILLLAAGAPLDIAIDADKIPAEPLSRGFSAETAALDTGLWLCRLAGGHDEAIA